MSTRTILLPIVLGVDLQPVVAQIAITLVGEDGAAIIAQTDAGGVTGGTSHCETATDAEVAVALIPNAELSPASSYRITLALAEGIKRSWAVTVPAGDTAIPWAELVGALP